MDSGWKPQSASKISKEPSQTTAAFQRQPPVGSGRVRLVIADDDPVTIKELEVLLGTRFDVVARARNGRELVKMVHKLSPAVAVADVTMPEMNGIEAARRITKAHPGVKVVMLSVYDDPTYIEAAFEAGASGYVLKLGASKELIQAIEDVMAGRPYRPHVPR